VKVYYNHLNIILTICDAGRERHIQKSVEVDGVETSGESKAPESPRAEIS